MQKRFIEQLIKKCGCTLNDNYLLCVSGGIDSIVLAYLFYLSKLNTGIAHCHFGIRGNAADKDALFVKKQATSYNIPYYFKAFDVPRFASSQKISFEMAARKLRYEWFEQIRQKYSYDYIVTAHHANDVAETILINLVRGTGIHGLTGIPVRNGLIIRPFLAFSKKEIQQYAINNNLCFRKDESNDDTTIFRNKIRHDVLPILSSLNPSIIQTFFSNAMRFSRIKTIYDQAVEKFKTAHLQQEGNTYKIRIEDIKKQNGLPCFLYETLKDFGFNSSDVATITDSFTTFPGKVFLSPTHCLLRDREFLFITPVKTSEETSFHIERVKKIYNKPFPFQISFFEKPTDYRYSDDEDIAYFDEERLHFPLTLRRWKRGDYFVPLGMCGKKKISDFFTDNKYTLIDKQKTWLLVSDNHIVWIVGKRIDDRFKITAHTQKVCIVKLMKKET